MDKQCLTLGLFDPGMTHLHRVGLAGLYMTLARLDPSKFEAHGSWDLEPTRIHIRWTAKPRDFFEPLLTEAFGISSEGAIQFVAHRGHSMGQAQRLLVSSAVLGTFLQHPQSPRKVAVKEVTLAVTFDDRQVTYRFKPVKEYKHQQVIDKLFGGDGQFNKEVELAGWAFPGGGVRHVAFHDTSLSASPERFLSLLFASAGSLYFLISRRTVDGKFDKRRTAALVLPHILDLSSYATSFTRYLDSPAQRLYAGSLGDAGLMGLAALQLQRTDGMIDAVGVNSCTVISLGTMVWAKQQKTRAAITHIRGVDRTTFTLFAMALRLIGNRVIVKEDNTSWVATSLSRGLIADNIGAGRPWFSDFWTLMQSQKQADLLKFDRKGLHDMIQQTNWPNETDRLFVEAVHNAIRNRYGAMAERARNLGETIRSDDFHREFERIRTSLMRAKNRETLRAEVADLFARGGINKVLQGNWDKVLGLFAGDDWQRARDLALLGLASYAGKGVEAMATNEQIDEEEEE